MAEIGVIAHLERMQRPCYHGICALPLTPIRPPCLASFMCALPRWHKAIIWMQQLAVCCVSLFILMADSQSQSDLQAAKLQNTTDIAC